MPGGPDPSVPDYNTNQFANVMAAVNEIRHPRQIGPYTVLGVIGEGGMGTIYRAEQREPIHRTVAIKIIKLGMDTAEVIARFEGERQALALMNHTNVAKVLDAGATEAGRPYFVMEYFKGEPITTYADKHKLTVHERLELFTQACDAVQHAHHKAIIHRDLKPSNILVTEQEGKPLVKVIDFGVAKALSQRLTERTLFTTTGQLVGTPEYMAPEQAESNAPDVDTRTDVYSLGVVLYELLSGSLPFDPQTLRSAGYNEIQRIIREVDPPRPSTRLTKLGARAEEVARQRNVELDALTRQLKSELEWIPLKAMRKERAQRYASPTELAEDLQNYLHNRPLRAGPESASYRARKFMRRNKTGIAASAAMLLLLIAGIITTTWQAIRANREKREAQFQRHQAVIASDNLKEVNRFLTEDLLASAAPEVTRGKEMSVREAVDRAAAAVSGRFKGRPVIEATVRMVLTDTYDSLGFPEKGLAHAERARDLLVAAEGPNSPKSLEAARVVGRQLNQDDRPVEGEALLRDVVSRCLTHLGERDAVTINALADLGSSIRRQRRYDEAETYFRRVVDLTRAKYGPDSDEMASALNGLAVVVGDKDKEHDNSEPLLREALRIWRRHGEDYLYYLVTLANLGRTIERNGRYQEAEAMYRECLTTRRRVFTDDHPSTLASMNDLANNLTTQKKFDEAEALNREALERRTRLYGPDDLGTLQSMNTLGNTLERRGKYEEAERVLRDCVERRKRVLTPSHPYTLGSTMRLVRALLRQQKWSDANQFVDELLAPGHFAQLAPDVQREMLEAKVTASGQLKRPAETEKYQAQLNALPSTQPVK